MIGMDAWPDRLRLLLLLLLALGVRLLYVTSLPPAAPIASVDAWGYHRLALNLGEGHGFSLRRAAPYLPDSVRTPLYPLFLLAIRQTLGPAPQSAALAQAALDSLTALLVYGLGGQLAGRRAGRAAALLYALNPTQVRYAGDLLAETLLAFLLTLCALALLKYVRAARPVSRIPYSVFRIPCPAPRSRNTKYAIRNTQYEIRNTSPAPVWLVLAALLTALCILCKPNLQFLPLIWAAAIVRARWPRLRLALGDLALLASIVLALLAPWVVRNGLAFGRPFLSTAWEGNVSRVSAPAALAQARGRYAVPWSDEWEGYFLELVSQAAVRYGWDKPWESLTARELDEQNHQVYLVARQALLRHPLAWAVSHLQGMLRYLEPQTYKVCYARFEGRDWPPDILDDVPLHLARRLAEGNWAEAGRLIVEERWAKLDSLRGLVWWGTLGGQVLGLALLVRGAWGLRRSPAAAAALALAVVYVLLLPGPIAYERFRVPAMGLILALIAANLGPRPT